MKKGVLSLVALLTACGGASNTTGPGPGPSPTPGEPPAAPTGFKVVGYAPSWTAGVTSGQWAKLTHVNYAFLNPNEGTTAEHVPNPALLAGLVTQAHAQDKRILLAVGGWTEQKNQGFEAAGRDAATAAAFADDMMGIVDQFGLDGIDIDWEWPSTSDGTDQRYARLMEALCSKMHGARKLCTTAVVATSGSGIPISTFAYVDWYNIMAYDMGTGPDHSPYTGAAAALNHWSARGLPAAKMVLGVPFYGRRNNWTEDRTYREIVAADPNAPNADVSNGYHYNGVTTTRNKTDLALQRAGGVMIWELSQDTTDPASSLLDAIRSRIR